MSTSKYPLAQVLEVKKKRVEHAEKIVAEKKQALDIEKEKLKKVQAEFDKIQKHFQDKRTQLNEAFDKGKSTEEVLQMKAYLKVVEERKKNAEAKVVTQQKQVEKATAELETAKKQLAERRKEEDKITMHKKEWEKEMKLELEKQDAKEQDEVGQLLYESHKRKKK